MAISLGQVKGNPREAYELIGVLETENDRLISTLATAAEALKPFGKMADQVDEWQKKLRIIRGCV